MGVEDALGVSISPARRSEGEQAWPVPPITSDRQASFGNEPERIAQRMYCLDAWEDGHQAKSIAVEIELSTIEARPKGNAGTYDPCFETGIAKTTFDIKNRLIIVVTWIEAAS